MRVESLSRVSSFSVMTSRDYKAFWDLFLACLVKYFSSCCGNDYGSCSLLLTVCLSGLLLKVYFCFLKSVLAPLLWTECCIVSDFSLCYFRVLPLLTLGCNSRWSKICFLPGPVSFNGFFNSISYDYNLDTFPSNAIFTIG